VAVVTRAALVEAAVVAALLRAEAVVTIAVAAATVAVDADAADSIWFLIAGKSNAAQVRAAFTFGVAFGKARPKRFDVS
jgi:hypothetical protein